MNCYIPCGFLIPAVFILVECPNCSDTVNDRRIASTNFNEIEQAVTMSRGATIP